MQRNDSTTVVQFDFLDTDCKTIENNKCYYAHDINDIDKHYKSINKRNLLNQLMKEL